MPLRELAPRYLEPPSGRLRLSAALGLLSLFGILSCLAATLIIWFRNQWPADSQGFKHA